MTITTPPRYIPIPSTIVYARTVPSSLKDFFGALYGLAWNTKYRFTPEMNVTELLEFLGLEIRTYQRYVQALERLSWLRSETHRNGCVRFSFPERFPIPEQRLTGAALNDKSDVYARDLAYTTNLSFSRDEEEDDLLTDPEKIRSSSSSSSKKLDILRAAGVIDTKLVMDDPGITADDVLAELAYCYDTSNHIRKPDRITGDNLLAGHHPSAIYYANYERYIPASILERAGLIEPDKSAPEPEVQFGHSEENPDPIYPGMGNSDPLPGGRSLEWAWTTVMEQLRFEMTRGAFADYVANTVPLAYNAAGHTFLIGTPSLYTAQWLEGRLTSTVKRLLTGIVNAQVNVRFVAPIA